jgi:hypothetical protein
MTDNWRDRRFGEGTTVRHVIAECLARRNHPSFDYIPPGVWAEAGAVVKALRAEGFPLRRARG